MSQADWEYKVQEAVDLARTCGVSLGEAIGYFASEWAEQEASTHPKETP